MGRNAITVAAVTLAAALSGCAAAPTAAPPGPPISTPAASSYAVGLRELHFSRGTDRPLRTLVLYPAAGLPADEAVPDAKPAAGKFPIVLYSHGLRGSPERYAPAATVWAAAGFVVALPAFPHTSAGVPKYDRDDVRNQPADAAYVIDRIRTLGIADGDRVAAVGHSAGGCTTAGMFTAGHDPRLKSGIVLAGWMALGAFAGPPADMLFIQGERDPVVPVADGRDAFDAVPWPKTYVLLPRSFHAEYMLPGKPGFDLMNELVTDFLRWTLTDDEGAHLRLPASDF